MYKKFIQGKKPILTLFGEYSHIALHKKSKTKRIHQKTPFFEEVSMPTKI